MGERKNSSRSPRRYIPIITSAAAVVDRSCCVCHAIALQRQERHMPLRQRSRYLTFNQSAATRASSARNLLLICNQRLSAAIWLARRHAKHEHKMSCANYSVTSHLSPASAPCHECGRRTAEYQRESTSAQQPARHCGRPARMPRFGKAVTACNKVFYAKNHRLS